MGVNIIGPATFAAQRQIATREAELRHERQILARFGAAREILAAPPSARARLVITRGLELAGFGQVAQLISPIFAALDLGPKRTGPRAILRDFFTTGTIPPEKIETIQGFKPIDARKFGQKVDEWLREIANPGTGQPLLALFGLTEQDVPRLREVFRFGFRRGEPLKLADGELVLSLPGPERILPFTLEKFRRQATELRTLARSRGVL